MKIGGNNYFLNRKKRCRRGGQNQFAKSERDKQVKKGVPAGSQRECDKVCRGIGEKTKGIFNGRTVAWSFGGVMGCSSFDSAVGGEGLEKCLEA